MPPGVVAVVLALVVTVPVRLTLTVTDSCTIVTPSIAGSESPTISLDSVIPNCRAQGVSAALHVERASPKEGSYIATIDF